MKTKYDILDCGYVELIDHWGSDQQIVESARMSTDKGFAGWDKDERFLEFLWTNGHATPFEMAGMIVEVKAPIFVFREWHRHRTQSYNEMSARYIPLPDESYMPDCNEVVIRSNIVTSNKQQQAANDVQLDNSSMNDWLALLSSTYEHCEETYNAGLSMGVPKEVARVVLPVGRYSKMRASSNLRNWLGFLSLRQAPNAQWEIRQYANAVFDIISDLFPRSSLIYKGSSKK